MGTKYIFVKKNFESLTETFLNPKQVQDLPKFTQEALKHGTKYEPVAKERFFEHMKYNLKRHINIRDTGIVIQPYLFWLGTSPDGLIVDSLEEFPGLIEIKCPKTKRYLSPKELLEDEKCYVGLQDGELYLKKRHSFGYYTQIQMAMGLVQASYCYFIVYTFKGLLIVKTSFDEVYFVDLVKKLNDFYKNYLLQAFIGST